MWTYPCNFMTDLIEVSNMDPHLMLLVFLPILLFESAFAVDMGILRKQISQIWLMALVGVVVASLVTALLVMAVRPSWEFNVCWLLGTITSATDPVAVVALLKDLGAAKTLGTLIEGESLLNDGSASEQGAPPPPRFSHAPGAAKTKSTTIAAMDDMEA